MEQVKMDFTELVKILKEGMPAQMKRFDSTHVTISWEAPTPIVEIRNLHVSSNGVAMAIDSNNVLPAGCELRIANCRFEGDLSLFVLFEAVRIKSCVFDSKLKLVFKENSRQILEIKHSKIGALRFYSDTFLSKCDLDDVQFDSLEMNEVSAAKNADFILTNITANVLNLAFKNPPRTIGCDWDMKEQIHYAAPTVPLVMNKTNNP